MACPTCKSKNLTEGQNFDEMVCRDCGCVYRESNDTIFIEGSFDKVCESASQFIMERIQNPTLRTEVSSLIDRYSNEGIESSEDLVRELEYIAEGLEITDSKSSTVIRNSTKKVKRIAENIMGMGIGSMLPTIAVNPMSQEEIPAEPSICGEPEPTMSPEEHLASMPYGDQVLEEEPGASLMGAGGQQNPPTHNWEEPVAGTPYEDPYAAVAAQDDMRVAMDQEIDDLENPVVNAPEVSEPVTQGPEGIEIPEPQAPAAPIAGAPAPEINPNPVDTTDYTEPEDEVMTNPRFESVDQTVVRGDRIFLESERGMVYTVDRVRGKFVDLISEEGDKMTVDASSTMLHEAEELDVAWEKKEASLDNLRKIYESMEVDEEEQVDESFEEDPMEFAYDVSNPLDEFPTYGDDEEDFDDYPIDDDEPIPQDQLDAWAVDPDEPQMGDHTDVAADDQTLRDVYGEDSEFSADIDASAEELLASLEPGMEMEALQAMVAQEGNDPEQVAIINRAIEMLEVPMEEGDAHDAEGGKDMSIEGEDGISSEDGCDAVCEGEDYAHDEKMPHDGKDEGSESIEGEGSVEPDEDVDNVMKEGTDFAHDEKMPHDGKDEGSHSIEGDGKVEPEDGADTPAADKKHDKDGNVTSSVEDADGKVEDGPTYSTSAEGEDKVGDIWGAEQLNETREMYTFLSSKLSYMVENHLNPEIRAAWDAFTALGDKLADLEKAYELPYENQEHPEMEHEEDDDDDDNGPDGGRKEEIESEIEELQSELEQLSESILQQFVHNSLGEPRNIGAPYVTERENGKFENTFPLDEEQREEGGHGIDEENGVYENLEMDEEKAQGEMEYVDEEVDSEGTEEPPTTEAEQREELEYSVYGGKHHVAVNESLQVSDTVYVRNDFKRKWTVTKIDGDILHVKSGKKTAVINTIKEDVQLVEGKDLMIERNMSIVNNAKAIWEEVEADISNEGKEVLTEGCGGKHKKMEEDGEELEEEVEEVEEEKEVVESAQIYSYIKGRDLQLGDRATALQEVASKFANPIGEIENIFEDACRDRQDIDEMYSFAPADTGMDGIMESKQAWLEMESELEDDDDDNGRGFFNI